MARRVSLSSASTALSLAAERHRKPFPRPLRPNPSPERWLPGLGSRVRSMAMSS